MVAAGILFIQRGRVLLLQRGPGGDMPGTWAFPGGKVKDGETLEDAARRECVEEMGEMPSGTPKPFCQTDDGVIAYTTFIQSCPPFQPTLNDEHTGYVWAELDALPQPMHPGAAATIAKLNMTEMDVAVGIRDGYFESPSRFENLTLIAMRITGTGTAYRSTGDEFVYRPPEHYLTPNFLARCNGLFVIVEHPDGAILAGKEFGDRIIGAVMLPYIQGDEVWGIVRVGDDDAARLLAERRLSTSPTVVFKHAEMNSAVTLDDGSKLLIEGKPSVLDHLAVCPLGVWDKGGPPSGVQSATAKESPMADDDKAAQAAADAAKKDADEKEKADRARADAETARWDGLQKFMDATAKRFDALEAGSAKKADAENEGGLDPKVIETTPAAVAEKAKADAAKRADDDARKKAEDEEEERKRREKADSDVKTKLDELEKRMPKEVSDADRAALADAQAKADSVFQAFGQRATSPLHGETLLAYRRRNAAALKQHSAAFRDIDISGVNDAGMLGVIEQTVYADAMKVARSPASTPAGTLRELKETSPGGHTISTFVGTPNSWMRSFKYPIQTAKFLRNDGSQMAGA